MHSAAGADGTGDSASFLFFPPFPFFSRSQLEEGRKVTKRKTGTGRVLSLPSLWYRRGKETLRINRPSARRLRFSPFFFPPCPFPPRLSATWEKEMRILAGGILGPVVVVIPPPPLPFLFSPLFRPPVLRDRPPG